jgi:hypothetical protein
MNKPTFEQVLKEIQMANVAIGENVYSEKSFGSWFITVQTNPKRRLVWDGKESWYVVQEENEVKVQGSEGWKDLWIDRHPKHNSALVGIEKLLGSARA